MSQREWVGWQFYAKHFSTPLMRADLNSALERQVGMAPYVKKVPPVLELVPQYGRGARKKRKSPKEVFELAQIAAMNSGAVVKQQGG